MSSLPPLPKSTLGELYDEKKMSEYGKQCADAMRMQCAQAVDDNAEYCTGSTASILRSNANAIRALEVE